MFARLSGDFNPLHVDESRARRSQFGSPVVHGIHLTLLALDNIGLQSPCRITSLDVQFRGAVLVGESPEFSVEQVDSESFRVRISVNSQLKATVAVTVGHDQAREFVPSALDPQPGSAPSFTIDTVGQVSGTEPLAIDRDALAQVFPRLANRLSTADIAALLASTRIVGMRCPGEWALYRRLQWSLGPTVDASDESSVVYSVQNVDRRFSMISISMRVGSVSMTAEVVLREMPPRQASVAELRSVIDESEFSAVRALVVGGSRGLGQLSASMLVAGGAQVMVTYRTETDEVAQLATELGELAQFVKFDVTASASSVSEAIDQFAPTHVLYFATPTISKRPKDTWDESTYQGFRSVYVDGLAQLLEIVQVKDRPLTVLFPSSTFVDDQPAGFSEYIKAKECGEQWCENWQDAGALRRAVVHRFPPLVTDQTAAKLGGETSANVSVVLPVVRKLVEN